MFWQSIQNSTYPAEFEAYLEQFPDGVFRELAQMSENRPSLTGWANYFTLGQVSPAYRAVDQHTVNVAEAAWYNAGWPFPTCPVFRNAAC